MNGKKVLGAVAGLMLLAASARAPHGSSAGNAGNRSAREAHAKCRRIRAETKELRDRIQKLEAQIRQKDAEIANCRGVKARNAKIIKKLETGQ